MIDWFFRHKVFNRTLLIGLCCGAVSVLIDLDHIPQILGFMVEQRFLHIPILIISIIGCAYFGGFLAYAFLKERKKNA